MLTSAKNPRIKQIRKLQNSSRARKKEGLFVVEGFRLVAEVLEAGWQIEMVLHTEDLGSQGGEIISKFRQSGVEIIPVAPHVMQAASDTQTPQGILAVIASTQIALPPNPDFILILDGIRDPGNIGTILRTALAAGIAGVLLPPGVVDPFSPKVLRGGMGAHFRLPIQSMDWDEIHQLADSLNLTLFLADSAGGQPYHKSDFESPLALIIGSEAEGASDQAQKLATSRVHIPMPGGFESLNAAVAGAILIFEVVRQRQSPVSCPQS